MDLGDGHYLDLTLDDGRGGKPDIITVTVRDMALLTNLSQKLREQLGYRFKAATSETVVQTAHTLIFEKE